MRTVLVLSLLTALALSTVASAEDYQVIRPTYPGTNAPDYSRPGYRVESQPGGYSVQPTYPGTSSRDYSRPGYQVERDGSVYQTLPGTNSRDYRRPGWRVGD